MPVQLSYPGVYVQEISSGAHSITGVATAITAFVGYTARGLDNRARRILSFSDFERDFGGLDAESELSYAVRHYFDNGGSDAYVVRVPKSDAEAADLALFDAVKTGKLALTLTAISKGAWANWLLADVDYDGVMDTSSFNLTLTDRNTGTQELFDGISIDPKSSRYCVKVINDPDSGSSLAQATAGDAGAARPVSSGAVGGKVDFAKVDSKAHDIKVVVDVPGALSAGINVPLIAKDDPVPTSVLGLARLVERKVNLVLQTAAPGATIRCVPNDTNDGLRAYADFDPKLVKDGSFDASLSFDTGTTGSLTGALKLPKKGDSTVNVGHYIFGVGRQLLAQNQAAAATPGDDGKTLPMTEDLIGLEADFSGIYALDKVDLFTLLCIPDATRATPGDPNTIDGNVDPNAIYAAALSFFRNKNRRAFLLVDPPPEVNDLEKATDWRTSGLTVHDRNAAAYFPRVRLPDPLDRFRLRTFAPCGVIAGLYARTDADRGVWKAPAGVEATLAGVQGQAYALTDLQNGVLNKVGLNCMRTFPIYGNVAWGARTLVGADDEASEWKYVPVRRLALFIEETLFRATKWVVFEPNDEPLWAQIRLNVGAFMHDLFRQGAFQGKTPGQAYLVKCDSETTTQNDIDRGVVNILVAFAPLKPAEFVVITIEQIAGQIQT